MRLSETKIIRNRTVYSVLTMISEVSGFADLLMVFTTFILSNFYSNFLLEKTLLRHMGSVELPNYKNKQRNYS